MLEFPVWQKTLKEIGFTNVLTSPVNPEEQKSVEKFLFVCWNHTEEDMTKLEEEEKAEWWEKWSTQEKEREVLK